MFSIVKWATALALGVAVLSGAADDASAQNASIWEQAKQTGTLRFGLVPNRPPYQWLKPNGEHTGLAIKMGVDLADAIAKELGRPIKIEYVNTSYATLVLDMQSNRLDAFFGLTDTEERRKAIDMIGPMYMMPAVGVTREKGGLGERWEDYNKSNVTVSVNIGTSENDAVLKLLPNAKINALRTAADAVLDAASGNAQIFVTAMLIGTGVVQRNPNLKSMILLKPLHATPSGAASRKDADGKFAKFAQDWSVTYRKSGAITKTIVDAVKETGFDLTTVDANLEF